MEIGYEVKLLTCMHTKKLHEKLAYFDKNGYFSYIPLINTLLLLFLFENYMSFFFMLEKCF